MGGLRRVLSRRSSALPSPPRRGWCGCGDPDVVMSDAADLVEVHTLRVVKLERLAQQLHSRTACSLVSTTALNCIAAYPPPRWTCPSKVRGACSLCQGVSSMHRPGRRSAKESDQLRTPTGPGRDMNCP